MPVPHKRGTAFFNRGFRAIEDDARGGLSRSHRFDAPGNAEKSEKSPFRHYRNGYLRGQAC